MHPVVDEDSWCIAVHIIPIQTKVERKRAARESKRHMQTKVIGCQGTQAADTRMEYIRETGRVDPDRNGEASVGQRYVRRRYHLIGIGSKRNRLTSITWNKGGTTRSSAIVRSDLIGIVIFESPIGYE